MKNKQLLHYMAKVFFSYFLAIGIPICTLSVMYIALTVPQITQEQYVQYQKEINGDMRRMQTVAERINDFSSMMMSDNALREAKKGNYEDVVFYYGQLMERLKTFTVNSDATIEVAIYIARGNRVFSPSFGICTLEEYHNRQLIADLYESGNHQMFCTDQNEIILTTALPRYYFDANVVLLYSIKLDRLYAHQEYENAVILAPNQSVVYVGGSIDQQDLDMSGLLQTATEVESIDLGDRMLWYQTEPNLGLVVGRIYGKEVVGSIVRSTIFLASSMLAASLLLVCVIAYMLARANVRPVAKLSLQLRQVNKKYAGKSIFDNITDFLVDVQNQNADYRQILQQSKEVVRDDAIRHLLWGRIPSEYSVDSFLSHAGIDKVPEHFVPVLIKTGNNIAKTQFSKTAELNILVKNIVEEQLVGEFILFGSTMLELDQIVFLLDGDQHFHAERLPVLLEQVSDLLMQKLSLGIRVAIGYPTTSSQDLCQCFVDMRKRMNSSAVRTQRVVVLEDGEESDGQIPEYLRSSMVVAIKQGNQTSVESILHQMIDVELERYPEEEVMELAFVVISNVLSNLTEYPELVEHANVDLFKIFSHNSSPEEKYAQLSQRLLQVAARFASQNAETEDNTYIGNALEYIHQNLNRDLSLSEIAQYLDINTSYFSRVFKTSIGVTPLQYITNLRMEKAKELLGEGRITIKDISETLGYNDIRSFIRFFKKSEGCTPSEYREKGE